MACEAAEPEATFTLQHPEEQHKTPKVNPGCHCLLALMSLQVRMTLIECGKQMPIFFVIFLIQFC